MGKIITSADCPKCNKRLIRKMPMKIKKIKPTKCNYCGFKIDNPFLIFRPIRTY